ncbi:MAG TPA: filamentous hemagglutinin N-terminal domain-containing protein, partial [Ramlibacter sp.]|nr:filamentous hemagglutinin N-terminal domain-containing protein [Ramlibacter sp.]
MSSLPSTSARRAAAPRLAAAPAVAGFRPKAAAVAVAAAFALQPQLAQAQPRGAHVIHGAATVTYNGANAVIRTTNGAGTRHSAIDWQSFSVPAGSITQFIQPSAASTSINRVVGNDPSAIYGTIRSNGNVVLVNPRGIAVGAGAVVDTNGFTASTLPLDQDDAIAGRRVFQGAGGALTVDGQVLARGGDVVLVGSSVQAGRGAVVRSQGATILAAGERVAVTGRGLEGIQMEVKAGSEAVNLGRLQGDAVAIFANTLRHSGTITADAVRAGGGKVVLKATGGDAYVDGTVVARAGDRGGRIDVLGERVALLAGASLRASGRTGGGQVRVGGDYQGGNAAVPNAKRVYMDADARIEADATGRGDGGRVIVWSDEFTRMQGNISARGGAAGGNGGFTEVSGKKQLEFTGRVDLRAPHGRRGQLLLDPEDIVIAHEPVPAAPPAPYGSSNTFPSTNPGGGTMFEPSSASAATLTDRHLNDQLATSDVLVKTSVSVDNSGSGGQITLNPDAVISWSSGSSLALDADKGITLAGRIESLGTGGVYLKARGGDITQPGTGKITTGDLVVEASGSVSLLGPNHIGTVAGTAGGEFFVKNAQSLTVGTATTFHASRSGITAGSVRVETTGTGADIDVASDVQASGGSIVLDAQGSIDAQADLVTQGGSGGSVTLHARGGDVRFGTIAANGGSGAQGGAVNVTAARDVLGNRIESNGGDGFMGNGGKGGTVHVKFGRDLRPASTLAPLTLQAQGGAGGIGDSMPGGNAGAGGAGGTVTLERQSGDMVLAGGLEIDVRGGAGGDTGASTGAAGAGGQGGRAILKAPGKTIIDGVRVYANGGWGGYASASGLDGAEGALGTLDTRSAITEVRGWLQMDAVWNNT